MSDQSAAPLLRIIAGRDTSGLIEVRCRNPRSGAMSRGWFKTTAHGDCLRYIEDNCQRLDVYVGAAPRTHYAGKKDAISHVWCLWADVDDPAGLERLTVYQRPSLVVNSGTPGCVHAYWALTEPLSPAWAERANRRLAHHLGADPKTVDSSRILRPPGTLNHKHTPPVPVTVAYAGDHTYPVAALVGHLPDPSRQRPARPQPRQLERDEDDALMNVPAERYYTVLTGRPVEGELVQCPFHKDGKERTPSLALYGYRGWYCFGCAEGGSIYEFAATLWGMGKRGSDFLRLKERLTDALGQ